MTAANFEAASVVEDGRKSEERHGAPGVESSKSSLRRARHISLQSRVESIADQSVYGYAISDDHAMPELPATYKPAGSQSHLVEPSYPTSYEPKSIGIARSSPVEGPPALPQAAIKMSTCHEIFFVGVVAVSHFITQAGLGQALAPLDIIAESFDIQQAGEASWFIAGYSLTVGTFILISGRLGDILGHKRVFAFGYAWLGVWAAFAGFSAYSSRPVFFDVCRGLQGIGSALIMPNGLALFGRAYRPGVKKNIVFSIFGAVAPAGFVAGAVFGSLFAQLAWWPWAFWSIGCVCWFLAALALLVVPKELSERPAISSGFDWTGSVVGVAGLILVNVAWNNGALYGWSTPHVYFLLIIGLLCLVGFVWVERRAENPILPLRTMTATVNFILACVGLGWGAFGIWLFHSFRFLEAVRGLTPLGTSAEFAPVVLCGLLAAGITGFLLTHAPVSLVMLIAMLAFATGVAVTAAQPAAQPYWAQTFVGIVIMPFGMDMSFPAATVILSNHMPQQHQGLAMSLVNTVINYSISIALGLAGTVERHVLKDGSTKEEQLKGAHAALYTAVGLAVMGVVCGALFFARSMLREGWKVNAH